MLTAGCASDKGGITKACADTTPPAVSSTVPVPGTQGVPLNANIAATFREAMDPSTIDTTTFILQLTTTSTLVSGTVTYAGVTATFDPESDLLPDTQYTATITTGVRDLAGNAMVNDYVWTFRSNVETDSAPPTLISALPANDATGISLNTNINAMFSEAVNLPDCVNSDRDIRSLSHGEWERRGAEYLLTSRQLSYAGNEPGLQR